MNFKVAYKAENQVQSAELGSLHFQGEIGRRIDKFVTGRVTGTFAKEEVMKEAEDCFRDQEDDIHSYGLWRGEFWGKLMLSAVRVCRMNRDEELRAFIHDETYRLLAFQREDGYLNTYKDSRKVFRADPEIAIKECGWPCTFNWNIWCRKYTLWALLEVAMLLDDDHVLACAQKMADQLFSDLDALKVRLKETGVMDGMPSSSILKPMLILYRLTGDAKYLDFAKAITAEWERPDAEAPSLLLSPYKEMSPNYWYKDGTMGPWIAKAYEMTSCFDGICEMYRVTGEEKYLRAAERFYEVLVRYESNILGGVGYCEHYRDAGNYPDSATEICDVIHWMRLCYELYTLTGKACYMASFEKAFVNAFLAGMYEDGLSGAFFVRSSGRHWLAFPQVETKYQNCCLNNVPRGFANAAQAAVSCMNGSLCINMYLPARFESDGSAMTCLTIGEGYFTTGCVRIQVSGAAEDTQLLLRIPEWSPNMKVKVNGEYAKTSVECAKNGTACATASADPSLTKESLPEGYLPLKLAAGENTIEIQFDMSPRIIDYTKEVVELPADDYHVQRWMGETPVSCVPRDVMLRHPMSTLMRGPLLLARTKRIGCDEASMFSQKTVCGQNASASVTPLTAEEGLIGRYRVELTTPEETLQYEMCDFASACNFYTEDQHYFTVFI